LLQELVQNLMDNAMKYTPAGGVVTLRTGQEAGGAFVQVQDDGPGIPKGEHEKVFARFHRVKGAPGAGAGLGLAIVKEIAERHAATVALSEPQGGGTRVTVSFPPARDVG
jgi:two-component system sensor histidine kinase TctE